MQQLIKESLKSHNCTHLLVKQIIGGYERAVKN
jgi:hypothetical protein